MVFLSVWQGRRFGQDIPIAFDAGLVLMLILIAAFQTERDGKKTKL